MAHSGSTQIASDDWEYWRALGQFVEAFSIAELSLFQYMTGVAEMTDPIARLVARSWHVNNMLDFIREVWKVTPLPAESAELKGVLDHFGAINALRNQVVHHISIVTAEGERISSNADRSMPTRTALAHRVSPQLLDDAAFDVTRIAQHLISVAIHPSLPFAKRVEEIPGLGSSWRYKQPPNLAAAYPPPSPKKSKR